MSVDEIMVLLEVAEVVVDCIVDEGHLNFFAGARLLQTHEVSVVVIDQILGRREGRDVTVLVLMRI